MMGKRGVILLLGFLVVMAGEVLGQGTGGKKLSSGPIQKDPPDSKQKPPEKKEKTDKPSGLPSLDKLGFPPGTVVIVVDDLKDAPSAPGMIWISRKKYQELLDKAKVPDAKTKSKILPHSCKLTGQVEGDFVSLKAEITLTTEEPKKTVFLGLGGANLKDEGILKEEGSLAERIPLVDYGPDGYVVQIEKPGVYQVALNLKLPVSLKRTGTPGGGADRGFELGLPGAAVTTLTLDLSPAVGEIRLNDHQEKQQPGRRGQWELALGKIKSLNLSWKEPVSYPGIGPLLSAEGKITIQLDESQVGITAELTLGDLRGQTKEWHLLLPPQAKVEVKPSGGVLPEIIPPEKKSQVFIIRLKEPGTERFPVIVHVNQPQPNYPGRLAIGPFTLLKAFQQQGNILVRASPSARRGLHLLYYRHPDLYQKEVPAGQDPDTVALFEYRDLPGPGKIPPASKLVNKQVPLELELKPEKGLLETQVEHGLQLTRGAESDAWEVKLTTRIKARSLSAGVDFLDLQLPRTRPEFLGIIGLSPLAFPGNFPWALGHLAVQKYWPLAVPLEFSCQGEGGVFPELQVADSQRRVRITWNRDLKDITLILTGKYHLPPTASRAVLELPRPVGVRDRGGRTTVTADDQLELISPEPGSEISGFDKHQYATAWEQAPSQVDFAWKPEFPVAGVTDVDVDIHRNKARVKHQIRFRFPNARNPDGTLTKLSLQVPSEVQELKIGPEFWDWDYLPGKGLVRIWPRMDAKAGEPLILTYGFALPEKEKLAAGKGKSRSFSLPLVWPIQTTRIEAKVRVWCDSGVVPGLGQGNLLGSVWRDRGTEVVPNRDSLPGLVLEAKGETQAKNGLPLKIRLLEGPANLPLAVFPKALVQATVHEDGSQTYRARFLVHKFNTDHVDVRLPAPAMKLVPSIHLEKESINNWVQLESDNRIIRIPVPPGFYSKPLVLDLEYILPSSLLLEGEPSWQTTLYPPQFVEDVFLVSLRWQVVFESREVPLAGGGKIHVPYQWRVRNFLLTPEPAWTGEELEHWLTGGDGTAETVPPSLVFWQTSLQPLRVWHFPRPVWLLLCSGIFLVLGLVLFLAPLTRFFFWFLLILLGLAALAGAFLWPSLSAPIAYGCQPGLVVLVLILGIQWLMQERYRRQVVFMPGFTRLKSNSSLVRAGTSNRPREASTVDAPAPSGSEPGSSISRGS